MELLVRRNKSSRGFQIFDDFTFGQSRSDLLLFCGSNDSECERESKHLFFFRDLNNNRDSIRETII